MRRLHLRIVARLAEYLASHPSVGEPVWFDGAWMDRRTYDAIPAALRARAQLRALESVAVSSDSDDADPTAGTSSDAVDTSRPTTQTTDQSQPSGSMSGSATQTSVLGARGAVPFAASAGLAPASASSTPGFRFGGPAVDWSQPMSLRVRRYARDPVACRILPRMLGGTSCLDRYT